MECWEPQDNWGVTWWGRNENATSEESHVIGKNEEPRDVENG